MEQNLNADVPSVPEVFRLCLDMPCTICLSKALIFQNLHCLQSSMNKDLKLDLEPMVLLEKEKA